ncbi:MAG: D-aminoacyl-tRNA deacylase [Oscillospiraceae bacterium]
MKVVIQRVSEANIRVDNTQICAIKQGMVVLLGIAQTDTTQEAEYLAKKVVNSRIFSDKEDKMNESVLDQKGEILIVSNFTLIADCKSGNRPSYSHSAKPEQARILYEYFISCIKNSSSSKVEVGQFGADMKVSLVNDGPVTIVMDTQEIFTKKGESL